MAKRKSRKNTAITDSETVELTNLESINSSESSATGTVVHFPKNTITKRKALDFSELYNIGCDDITTNLQSTIRKLIDESVRTRGNSLSFSTIENYYVGTKIFLHFCEAHAKPLKKSIVFTDIDSSLIKQYLTYLSELGL